MSEIEPKQIEKQVQVKDIPESLNYVDSGPYETKQMIDRFGISHNPDSIVREDSYLSLWYGNNPDSNDFEIYVSHYDTPHLGHRAYKIDISEINQYEVSFYE